jgi:hypothetical protein
LGHFYASNLGGILQEYDFIRHIFLSKWPSLFMVLLHLRIHIHSKGLIWNTTNSAGIQGCMGSQGSITMATPI